MQRRWVRTGFALVAVAMSGTTACGSGSTEEDAVTPATSASSPAPVHVVTEAIYLDSSTLFGPPPEGTTPKLDAEEAFDAFAGDDRAIPDNLDYELGLLTVPPSVTDVLVWGFHPKTPGGCLRSQPLRTTPEPTPSPPPPCIPWDFINANDGHFEQGMGQILSGPGSQVPSPSPPAGTDELARGGALPPNMERFSPDRLVVQAPLSTIRWTFDMADCNVDLHWFLPADDARSGPGARPCRAAGRFSVDETAAITSHSHVFAVVAGHIDGPFDSPGYLVRVLLANGDSMLFDPDQDNRAWIFPVQRCGDFTGTLPVAVEEVKLDNKTVVDRLPVPSAAFDRQSADDCGE